MTTAPKPINPLISGHNHTTLITDSIEVYIPSGITVEKVIRPASERRKPVFSLSSS